MTLKIINRPIMVLLLCSLVLPHTSARAWNIGSIFNSARPLFRRVATSRFNTPAFTTPAIIIAASTAAGLGLWYLNRRQHISEVKRRQSQTPEYQQNFVSALINRFAGRGQAARSSLLRQHVAGYQPASDNQLARVPYFENLEHHIAPPIRIADNTGQEVIVQQLRASDQFGETLWETSDGGTSCGYHAGIKNSTAIAGLARGMNYGTMLTDPQLARNLFDPLREQINIERQKTALRSYYAHRLTAIEPEPLAANENTRRIQSIYRDLLRDALDNFIAQAFYQRNDIAIEPQTIIDALQRLPINGDYSRNWSQDRDYGEDWTPEELEQFTRNEENMQRYIQHLDVPLIISLSDIDEAWEQYNAQGFEALEHYGDWLNSDEIERLVEHLRKGHPLFAPALHNIPFIALETTQRAMLGLEETVLGLRHAIVNQQTPAEPMYALALGSTNQATGARGHWVTLFIEFAQGMRRYTAIDSAGNTLRLFNGPCYDVIRYLEGHEFANALRPTQQMRTHATQQLGLAIKACEQDPGDLTRIGTLQQTVLRYQSLCGDNFAPFGGAQRVELLLTPPPPPLLLEDNDEGGWLEWLGL